jgi:hypothetical protein
MQFPKLPSAVKELVRLGIYSLYSVKGESWYWLRVPGKTKCCNGDESPGIDYKISKDGKVLDTLTDSQNIVPEAAIFLTKEDVGQDGTHWSRPVIN